MADTLTAPEIRQKVVNLSVTVFPRHHELVQAVRVARASSGEIPNKSDIVKEAIEEMARRELDAERFERLMAGAA